MGAVYQCIIRDMRRLVLHFITPRCDIVFPRYRGYFTVVVFVAAATGMGDSAKSRRGDFGRGRRFSAKSVSLRRSG